SLVPLLNNPAAAWDRAVVSTWLPNNHVVIKDQWRYIRYREGNEELYDLGKDPNEFMNLAADPVFAEAKASLARWLPKQNAPILHVPGKKTKQRE
ncbi:MAG: iduronate-2-sulfatase, partial [Pirellulaceae bacterium]